MRNWISSALKQPLFGHAVTLSRFSKLIRGPHSFYICPKILTIKHIILSKSLLSNNLCNIQIFVVKSLHFIKESKYFSLSFLSYETKRSRERLKKCILKIEGFQSVILPWNNLQTCHFNT